MCRGWQWEEVHEQDEISEGMIKTGESKEGALVGVGSDNIIAGTDADKMMQTLRSPPLVAIGTFCYYSKEQEGAFKICGRVWTQEEYGHIEKDNYHQIGDAEESEHGKVDWYHGGDVDPRERTHHKGSERADVHEDTHIAEADTRERMHPDMDNVYHEPAETSRPEYAEADFWEREHRRTPEGHYGVRGEEYEQNEHYIDAGPHGRKHAKREMDDDYYYAEEEAEGDEEREYFEPTKHPDYVEDQHEEPTWHKTVKNGFYGENMSDEMGHNLGSHHGSQGDQKVVRAHDKWGFYREDEQELWHGRGENQNDHGHKRQEEQKEEKGQQGKEPKFHLRKALFTEH